MTTMDEFAILEINLVKIYILRKWLLNSNNSYSKNQLYRVLFSYYINLYISF